jgi:hypothetical protein
MNLLAGKAMSAILQRGDVNVRKSRESFVQVARPTDEPADTFSTRISLSTAGVVMVNIKNASVLLSRYSTCGTLTALSGQQRGKGLPIDMVQPPRIRESISSPSGAIRLRVLSSPLNLCRPLTFYVGKAILSQIFNVSSYANIASALRMHIRRTAVYFHSNIVGLRMTEHQSERYL